MSVAIVNGAPPQAASQSTRRTPQIHASPSSTAPTCPQLLHVRDSYTSTTALRPNSPTPENNVSVTLGIQVDIASQKRIRFLRSNDIPLEIVNETCERCSLMDCHDRVAPPTVLEGMKRQDLIQKKLKELERKKKY